MIIVGDQNNKNLVGTFTYEEVLNEVEISKNKRYNALKIGMCMIEIYPNEGPIPHFHISS